MARRFGPDTVYGHWQENVFVILSSTKYLFILITFLVRQVRCPQLVEGTFPLSYYLIKLLLLLFSVKDLLPLSR